VVVHDRCRDMRNKRVGEKQSLLVVRERGERTREDGVATIRLPYKTQAKQPPMPHQGVSPALFFPLRATGTPWNDGRGAIGANTASSHEEAIFPKGSIHHMHIIKRIFILASIPAVLSMGSCLVGGLVTVGDVAHSWLLRASCGSLLVVYAKEIFDGTHTATMREAASAMIGTAIGGALLVMTGDGPDSVLLHNRKKSANGYSPSDWPVVFPFIFGFAVDGFVVAFNTRSGRKRIGGWSGVPSIQGVLFAVALSIDNVLEGFTLAPGIKEYAGSAWPAVGVAFGVAVLAGAWLGHAVKKCGPLAQAFFTAVLNIGFADSALDLAAEGGLTWGTLVGFIGTWILLVVGDRYEEAQKHTHLAAGGDNHGARERVALLKSNVQGGA
jgi:hypothetical protein